MDEGGGDVLPGLGAGQNPGSRVLYVLEPVQGIAGYSGQDSIAIIKVYKVMAGVWRYFCGGRRQIWI